MVILWYSPLDLPLYQSNIYTTMTSTGHAELRRHKNGLISFRVEIEGIEGELKIKSFFYHHK